MKINLNILAKSTFTILAAGSFVLFVIGGVLDNEQLINTGFRVVGAVILGSLLIAGIVHGPRWFRRR